MIHLRLCFACAVVVLLAAAPARAAPELITNGDFERTSLTSSTQLSGSALTGWTNAAASNSSSNGTGYAYNFLALPGTADTSGFTTLGGTRNRLIGPDGSLLTLNYGNNGLTDTSPAGGNYLIASTDSSRNGAISQTISGLTVGQAYTLSFYWAAAQFAGTLASTSEYWSVTFGGTVQFTATATQAAGGFTPWTKQTLTYVASATTQTLSFLAVGTPGGVPAAGLLDGVSLSAVPEPPSWALGGAGLSAAAALGLFRRRNR